MYKYGVGHAMTCVEINCAVKQVRQGGWASSIIGVPQLFWTEPLHTQVLSESGHQRRGSEKRQHGAPPQLLDASINPHLCKQLCGRACCYS